MNYHHGNLRRELLDRAAHVIAEQGVEALSLRALAQELGVSHGAPARHFRDKLDLLRVLAKEGFQRFTQYVLAAADAAGPDPVERLAAMVQAYVRFSQEFPADYKATLHPDVTAQADDELKQLHRARSEILFDAARQAQAAGWLKRENLETVVAFGFAAARGLAVILNDPLVMQAFGRVNRDALIDQTIRLVVGPSNPQTARNATRSAPRKVPKKVPAKRRKKTT